MALSQQERRNLRERLCLQEDFRLWLEDLLTGGTVPCPWALTVTPSEGTEAGRVRVVGQIVQTFLDGPVGASMIGRMARDFYVGQCARKMKKETDE